MKTIAYIDGYNLYYSLLRGSPYKWLDVVRLVDGILKIQAPTNQLLSVKFFTAPVLANYARHGAESVAAQSAYLRALDRVHGTKFCTIQGRHSPAKEWLPAVVDDTKLDRSNKTHVWKLSEKQTDVNLTLHMYRDAILATAEQVVLVSNDSDFEPLLKSIRADTSVQVGLIAPLPKLDAGKHRRPSVSLQQNAHWARTHILESELNEAQLSEKVSTKKAVIRKPAHW